MVADVIQFGGRHNAAAKIKPVEVEPVHLPDIYRLTGFGSMADTMPAYSLNPDEEFETDNLKWIKITHLDPQIDSGWVIVRRHRSEGELKGYINGQMDFLTDKMTQTVSIGCDERGFYSVIAREAIEGCPDHLLVFVFTMETELLNDLVTKPDIYFIYHPDGQPTYDSSIMYKFMEK
jgi:hypothetical protein